MPQTYSFGAGMPASMASLNTENPYWARQAQQRYLDAIADAADAESLDKVFANDPVRQRLNAEARVAGTDVLDEAARKKKIADTQAEADAYFQPDVMAKANHELSHQTELAQAQRVAPAQARGEADSLQALINSWAKVQAAIEAGKASQGRQAIQNIPKTVDEFTGQPNAAAPSNERFLPPAWGGTGGNVQVPPIVSGPKGSAPGWMVEKFAQENGIPVAQALRMFQQSFGAQ